MGCTHTHGLEATWSEVRVADDLVRDARGQQAQLPGEQRHGRDRLYELRLSWRPAETCEGDQGS